MKPDPFENQSMSPTSAPPSAPPPPVSAPASSAPPPAKKRRWFLYGCGSLLALVLLIVLTVAITIWWIQRPIKPVVLSAKEKATVEEKLQRLNAANTGASAGERGAQITLAPLKPE